MDRQTDRQGDSSVHPKTFVLQGYNDLHQWLKIHFTDILLFSSDRPDKINTHGWTNGQTDRQADSSIPPTTFVLQGYNDLHQWQKIHFTDILLFSSDRADKINKQ